MDRKKLDRGSLCSLRSLAKRSAALAGKFIKRPTRHQGRPVGRYGGAAALIKRRNVADGPGPVRAGALFTKIISRTRNKLRVGTFNKPTPARYGR